MNPGTAAFSIHPAVLAPPGGRDQPGAPWLVMLRRLALSTLLLCAPLACSGDDGDTAGTSDGGHPSAGGSAGSGGGAAGGSSGSSGQSGAAGATAGKGGSSAGGQSAGGQSAGGQSAGSGAGGSDAGGSDAGGSDAGGAAGSGEAGGGQGGLSGNSGQSGSGQAGDAPGGQAGSEAGGQANGGEAGQAGANAGGASAGGASAGGASGGTAGSAGGSAGAAGSAGSAPVDACASKEPVCPKAPAGYGEGDGLASIDRCAFPLAETSAWTTFAPLVDALAKTAKPVTLAHVLGDLNRSAVRVTSVPGSPPGLKQAFRWDSDDNDKAWWIPQGITGSPDAAASGKVAGRQLIVVSWYYDLDKHPNGTEEKGVRIAIVDTTDPAKPTYRLALLVEPTGTVAQPGYKAVTVHAGGIVWYGDHLYVADTSKGFRVFDMTRIFQVATDKDTIGCAGGTCQAGTYKYVLPQVGAYRHGSSCAPLFSWVSLDRSVSPPTLVSGEYCSTTACSGPIAGRTFRWPLDPATGRLSAPKLWPSAAYLMGQKQIQGGAAHDGLFFFSSSAPAGGGGALYRVKGAKSKTSAWIDMPEDLMVDQPRGWLWTLSEGEGARYVMAAALASYPAP